MTDIPTRFEDAVGGFKAFLAGQSLKGELRWVFRDDVAIFRGKYLIRFPLPASNEVEAKMLYEAGVRDGHGMGLECFAMHENTSYCFVRHALINDSYGLEMLPGNLRYTCATKPHPIRLFRHRYMWWMVRSQGKQWLTELPTLDACRKQRGIDE